jgi:hypothetical protein
MPRLVACGGRDGAFNDFRIAHGKRKAGDYIALLIDSEEALADVDKTWQHLAQVRTVQAWARPGGADDDQVLFMTTCMETLIVADRKVLREHFGSALQETALPAQSNPEARDRHAVQHALVRASRNCKNAYAKGSKSFEIVGKLTPATLKGCLPSFARWIRVLNGRL